MAGVDLSGYVDVAERLREFFARYPDGSIQTTPPKVIEIAGRTFLEVVATVYRNPTDPTPATDLAWEPFPGRTPYTRDSEAMNCSTSATGRALAYLGIGVRRAVASADEVRARQVEPKQAPKQETDRARQPRQSAALKALRAELRKQIPDMAERQAFVEQVVDHPAAGLDDLTADELDLVAQALTLHNTEPGSPDDDADV